jgi:hypothetical protein
MSRDLFRKLKSVFRSGTAIWGAIIAAIVITNWDIIFFSDVHIEKDRVFRDRVSFNFKNNSENPIVIRNPSMSRGAMATEVVRDVYVGEAIQEYGVDSTSSFMTRESFAEIQGDYLRYSDGYVLSKDDVKNFSISLDPEYPFMRMWYYTLNFEYGFHSDGKFAKLLYDLTNAAGVPVHHRNSCFFVCGYSASEVSCETVNEIEISVIRQDFCESKFHRDRQCCRGS